MSPAGHHLQITNVDGDDYVREVMTIRVTDPDGHVLQWALPERLTRRADVLAIVVEEMQAAIRERRERAS